MVGCLYKITAGCRWPHKSDNCCWQTFSAAWEKTTDCESHYHRCHNCCPCQFWDGQSHTVNRNPVDCDYHCVTDNLKCCNWFGCEIKVLYLPLIYKTVHVDCFVSISDTCANRWQQLVPVYLHENDQNWDDAANCNTQVHVNTLNHSRVFNFLHPIFPGFQFHSTYTPRVEKPFLFSVICLEKSQPLPWQSSHVHSTVSYNEIPKAMNHHTE